MGFRIPQRVTLVCTISSFQSCGFVWSSGKDGSDRNTKTLRWVTFANFASSGFWNDARIRPLMKSIRPSPSSSPMVDDEPRVYEPSVSCLYQDVALGTSAVRLSGNLELSQYFFLEAVLVASKFIDST